MCGSFLSISKKIEATYYMMVMLFLAAFVTGISCQSFMATFFKQHFLAGCFGLATGMSSVENKI